MAHTKWIERGLDNISQNRMRKESLTSCVNGNSLMLFFFQITDQIFTDRCECVTKFKMVIIEKDTALIQYYFFIQLEESYFLP